MNSDPDASKVIQIVPATGWFSIDLYEDTPERSPIVLWGLCEDGDVIPLCMNVEGEMDDPRNYKGFICIHPAPAEFGQPEITQMIEDARRIRKAAAARKGK
jgi:hypothetical protein